MTLTQSPGLVSVLMGAYNCADTVEDAVRSIQTQTYESWELIICDDASTDSTLEVLRELAASDPRIILLENPTNLTLAPTLNKCLQAAHGDLVARMDGDDRCDPQRFDIQAAFLASNPDVDVVSTALTYFDEDGAWGSLKTKPAPCEKDLIRGTPFAHAACMMRRESLIQLGGYSEEPRHRRVEDYELWVRLYERGGRGVNLPDALYHVRNDRSAALRRTWGARWNEARLMHSVAQRFGFSPTSRLRAVRPLLLGLVPAALYRRMYRLRHGLGRTRVEVDA